AFVEQIYPRMQTMMEYVLGRTNRNGMVEGLTGDWVFVDWADGYLDKKGELSIEQVLLCKSLETMALCAALAGEEADVEHYQQLSETLRSQLKPAFWNEAKQALVHNRIDGVQSEAVTRYANMFATFYGYLTPEEQTAIKSSVLLNDAVLKIVTPYMRFYELEALCVLGEQEAVMREMKAYWGGMLREGATSFWEKYNPEEQGREHLQMYGRPYGKSLCHAWGASPIYLLGRYYLGVKPTTPGYATYEVRPVLGGLEWMEGTIPTPQGEIYVSVTPHEVRVRATAGEGLLYLPGQADPVKIEAGVERVVAY
ncbi:MAG: alpha-rhamnosidase, partial [Alistipes sp.]|nr:alpha-rhamnosidase [Alistipes sp.]